MCLFMACHQCKQARIWHVISVNKCHLASHEYVIKLILLHSKTVQKIRFIMSYYEAYGYVNVHGIHLMEKYFNLIFHVNTQRQIQPGKQMLMFENIAQIITDKSNCHVHPSITNVERHGLGKV